MEIQLKFIHSPIEDIIELSNKNLKKVKEYIDKENIEVIYDRAGGEMTSCMHTVREPKLTTTLVFRNYSGLLKFTKLTERMYIKERVKEFKKELKSEIGI